MWYTGRIYVRYHKSSRYWNGTSFISENDVLRIHRQSPIIRSGCCKHRGYWMSCNDNIRVRNSSWIGWICFVLSADGILYSRIIIIKVVDKNTTGRIGNSLTQGSSLNNITRRFERRCVESHSTFIFQSTHTRILVHGYCSIAGIIPCRICFVVRTLNRRKIVPVKGNCSGERRQLRPSRMIPFEVRVDDRLVKLVVYVYILTLRDVNSVHIAGISHRYWSRNENEINLGGHDKLRNLFPCCCLHSDLLPRLTTKNSGEVSRQVHLNLIVQ